MRVLIQGHCSLKTQMAYFQTFFPDWDVRGVLTPIATKWINEGNEKFLEFVDQVDMFVGLVDHGTLKDRVPAHVQRLRVSAFSFVGYHPDAHWIAGVPAPTELGAIHSRIAASAYLLGGTEAEAQELFNQTHFANLGYFDYLENDRQQVIARFRAECNVDLSPLFDRWMEKGNFLYTPNHPQNAVFFDVIHEVMCQAGHSAHITPEAYEEARANLEEYLETSIIWPIYPEIADFHGVPHWPRSWRLSSSKSSGEHFGLEAFLARSWAVYDANKDKRDLMIAALGGEEMVKRAGTA